MRLPTLLLFLAGGGIGLGAVISYDSPKQELFVLNQKIDILYYLIRSECPNYVDKRSVEQPTNPIDITVAKGLYKKLTEKYTECKRLLADKADKDDQARDCQDYYSKGERKSGVYTIRPDNSTYQELSVWCDFVRDRGWIVIQKRSNGSESFDRTWSEYKSGFGDITGEHWLGNDKIHEVTRTNFVMNIHLEAENMKPGFGTWQEFRIADEADKYKLFVNGTGYKGTLLDDFSYHGGSYFTTKDRDNNLWSSINCADKNKGGWWYSDCGNAHPTASGMSWISYSTKTTYSVMRVTRPWETIR